MSEVIDATEITEAEAVQETQRDLYLTFHLCNEDYAISITCVTEIIGIQEITVVPDLPDFVRGVINLRGRVIPVMDVRLRFSLPEREYDERTCVIVVDVNGYTTGLVVDRVKDVVEIPLSQIEAPPLHGGAQGFISGLGKVNNEVKIILDMGSVFAAELLEVEVAEVA
jgi:purine-binding chemotaxis protein CheW